MQRSLIFRIGERAVWNLTSQTDHRQAYAPTRRRDVQKATAESGPSSRFRVGVPFTSSSGFIRGTPVEMRNSGEALFGEGCLMTRRLAIGFALLALGLGGSCLA